MGRMPAEVMDALHERDDVTLILHLPEDVDLVIEAGQALEHDPNVECYDLNWLVRWYMTDVA